MNVDVLGPATVNLNNMTSSCIYAGILLFFLIILWGIERIFV
jgi:hypothetical protein